MKTYIRCKQHKNSTSKHIIIKTSTEVSPWNDQLYKNTGELKLVLQAYPHPQLLQWFYYKQEFKQEIRNTLVRAPSNRDERMHVSVCSTVSSMDLWQYLCLNISSPTPVCPNIATQWFSPRPPFSRLLRVLLLIGCVPIP